MSSQKLDRMASKVIKLKKRVQDLEGAVENAFVALYQYQLFFEVLAKDTSFQEAIERNREFLTAPPAEDGKPQMKTADES